MIASQNPTPVTLPVTDINEAKAFYLSALRPLGYGFVSQVNHSTASASSEAIGLGPENSSRVDLFLSQSNRTAAERHGGKTAHIVFPAPSKAAVHDFYSDGLKAGGKACHAPHVKHGEQGLFVATLVDDDGNKLEVCYCEPGARPPDAENGRFEPCEPLDTRTSDMDNANRQLRRRSFSRSSNGPDPNTYDPRATQARQPMTRTTFYPIDTARDRPASVVSRGNSVRSSSSRKSRNNRDEGDVGGHKERQSSPNGGTGNAVVGTLLGAAAGAAVAYAFAKSAGDSRQKEEEFERKMKLRREAKAEAKARSMALDWRDKARSTRSRRRRRRDSSGGVERDSGYQSMDRRDASSSPREIRKFTYPQRERRSSNGSGNVSWPGREDEYEDSKKRLPTRSRTVRDVRRTDPIAKDRKPSPPPPPSLGSWIRRGSNPQSRRTLAQNESTAASASSRRDGSATGSPSRASTRTAVQQQPLSRQVKGDDKTETGSRTSRGSRGSRATASRKQSPPPESSSVYTKVKVPPSPPPSYKSTVHSANVARAHARSILGDEFEHRKDEFWNQDDDLDTLVPDDSVSVADGPPSQRLAKKLDNPKSSRNSSGSNSGSRRNMGGGGRNIEGVVMG